MHSVGCVIVMLEAMQSNNRLQATRLNRNVTVSCYR